MKNFMGSLAESILLILFAFLGMVSSIAYGILAHPYFMWASIVFFILLIAMLINKNRNNNKR